MLRAYPILKSSQPSADGIVSVLYQDTRVVPSRKTTYGSTVQYGSPGRTSRARRTNPSFECLEAGGINQVAERLAVIGQGSDQRSSISSEAEPVVEEKSGGGAKKMQEIFYVNRNNSTGHPGQMSH